MLILLRLEISRNIANGNTITTAEAQRMAVLSVGKLCRENDNNTLSDNVTCMFINTLLHSGVPVSIRSSTLSIYCFQYPSDNCLHKTFIT